MKGHKTEKIRDWTIVFSYTLLIYISLPVMPGLWAKFARYAGDFTNYIAGIVLAALGLYIVFYLISRRKGLCAFIWLGILAFFYTWGLSRLELPIERIHFIEYGLLSLFVFRALRHNINGKSIYLWSGIAVFCLGFLDEGIQYALPNRVYETKDVIINGFAGVLGLFLIGLCFQPELKNPK